jgi:integrase
MLESATGKGVLYVTKSKNESSKRVIPLNQAAREAVERMLKRADSLGHTGPNHYVWCASQHHKFDPTMPASKWDGAWRSLRKAAGLPGFRFHDLRHTVVTDLLEAGEPEHVIEAITGHLSRRMLEHYSHQRLKAKGQMLTRMEQRRKKSSA